MSDTLTVTVVGLVADTLECIIQHRERMMLVVREMYDGIVAYIIQLSPPFRLRIEKLALQAVHRLAGQANGNMLKVMRMKAFAYQHTRRTYKQVTGSECQACIVHLYFHASTSAYHDKHDIQLYLLLSVASRLSVTKSSSYAMSFQHALRFDLSFVIFIIFDNKVSNYFP